MFQGMPRATTRAWARLILPLVVPVVLLATLRRVPRLDVVFLDLGFHLVVVSGIAGCALVVALVAARVGTRSSHHGPVWLAVGCLSVGILMLGHGLLTPGVLDRPMNVWVARTPYAAITCFAAALVVAGRPRNASTSRLAIRHPVAVVAVPAVLLAAVTAFLVADPTRLGGTTPLADEETLKWVVAVADWLALSGLTAVHWRRWRLGHDPVQYALVLASAMSMGALLSLRVGETWRLSWWDYHGFLLAGFGAAVYAVWVRYRRAAAAGDVLVATFERDPMAHIVQGYPQALKALVAAVEVKDPYTHGHSQRTAITAVQLGLRLGLGSDALRAVARGAYLHDVGKIAIPDHILNKPAILTAEERAVIETHPRVGYELVHPVADLHEVIPAVLHHHERWDGCGYPDRLEGRDIPLAARLVAVADVWDALTSDRSYRPGMAPQAALAHIAAGSGTHFDPRLVDAMVALAADWGYTLPTRNAPGDPDQAWEAAETCHEVAASRV